MIQKINIFRNSSIGIQQEDTPDGVMRTIVIQDNDTEEVWRFAMAEEQAKLVGQQLMGIGNITVANGKVADEVIRRAKGGKH